MILYQFIITIIISGIINNADSSARRGYDHYPEVNKYYKFHSNPKTWFDAKSTCKSENATLAMPADEEEMKILTEIYNYHPVVSVFGVAVPDFMLLGFHDMFNEGEYITVNGDSIQYHFHKFAHGQPDNLLNEDCGSMLRSGELNDYNCGMPALFTCQKGSPFIETNNDCITTDPAYKYSKELNKCYKLHLNPMKWADARAICQAEGGNLAVIRSKPEEEFLVKMFNNPHNKVYYVMHKDHALIGIHNVYRKNNYITVLDEDIHDVGYINWYLEKIGGMFGSESCGSMHSSGAISSFSCSVPATFFCQQPAATFSPLLDIRFKE